MKASFNEVVCFNFFYRFTKLEILIEFIFCKIYVNSYIWNGSDFVEAIDSEGKNIGRSLFIRSGWTGMYHEPFTEKYHTLFREYDPPRAANRDWKGAGHGPASYGPASHGPAARQTRGSRVPSPSPGATATG